MKTSSTDASLQGLTAEYQPADASIGRLPVEVPTDSGQATEEDLRSLLHRRLRFLCLLLAVLYVIGFSTMVFENVPPERWRFPAWNFRGSGLVTVLLAGVVWARRSLTLRQLRAIELVLVVILITRIIGRGDGAFWAPWAQGEFNRWRATGDEQILYVHLLDASHFICYVAAVYIVAYGVCIPNTRRRCILVVGGLWSVAPIVWVVGILTNDLPGFGLNHFVLASFALLTAAAVLAVYGSHRIETLRQAAVQARRLGQYVLKKRLGGGGMGEVFLADHLLLRRPCAIKFIRPERASDPAMLQRFEREVRATATLTHPNRVQIFDYGRAQDRTFYYVMEYLPGLTLEEMVKQQGPLTPARVVHFLRQLCGALAEAHAIGLIHRDIKPGNVIVCERGRIRDVAKLLDFGLVQSHFAGDGDGRLTQQGSVIGTPAFLSPEQAGGGDSVDARSDIYSLGALAYFLLAGQAPFSGRSQVKMLAAHLYEAPAPLTSHRSEVPPELEAIILKCLAKNAVGRFSDIESLATALRDCATGKGWTEEPATKSSPSQDHSATVTA